MGGGFSWAHYSNTALLHYSIGLLLEDPGVLAAAPLRGVYDQGSLPQRHPGQAAGNDRDLLAVQDERPQIEVAPLHGVVAKRGSARKRYDRLGDVVPGILANL